MTVLLDYREGHGHCHVRDHPDHVGMDPVQHRVAGGKQSGIDLQIPWS